MSEEATDEQPVALCPRKSFESLKVTKVNFPAGVSSAAHPKSVAVAH